MPVGVEIFNDNGVIQIDENYPCLSLRHKGSATLTQLHPVMEQEYKYSLKYVDITFEAETPLLAVYGRTLLGVIAVRRSGSQWTFRVAGVIAKPPSDDWMMDPSFTYFVFDKPQPSPSSGAGLEVYDANAQLVFSSAYQPLTVSAALQLDTVEVGSTASVSLPSSGQYAIAANGLVFLDVNEDHQTNGNVQTTWTFLFKGALVAGNGGTGSKSATIATQALYGGSATTQGNWSYVPPGPTGDLGGWGNAGTCLVIDVKDYL